MAAGGTEPRPTGLNRWPAEGFRAVQAGAGIQDIHGRLLALRATSRKSSSGAASTCRCDGRCCRMTRPRCSITMHAVDLQRVRLRSVSARMFPKISLSRCCQASSPIGICRPPCGRSRWANSSRRFGASSDHGRLPMQGRLSCRGHDPGAGLKTWYDNRSGCYLNVSPRPAHLRNEPDRFEMQRPVVSKNPTTISSNNSTPEEARPARSADAADGFPGASLVDASRRRRDRRQRLLQVGAACRGGNAGRTIRF